MMTFDNKVNRIEEDRGASNSISFMVIMLFIMTMLVSFIDVGLYFNVKNQMTAAAENGARSVALYGGVNTNLRDVRGGSLSPEDVTWETIPDNFKSGTANKTVEVNRSGIVCSPKSGKIFAGDPVKCEVTYIYNGIAGRFSLFNIGRGNNAANKSMKVTGTSVSEVTIK